ncbi:LysM peptidoglycan-binding domain-containing protein [Flexivirga sp. B27]
MHNTDPVGRPAEQPGAGPRRPGQWHRLRAAALGVIAAVVALLAAYGAWGGMLGELHRLERRGTMQTSDALPVLLWAALVLALLWAAVLIALATSTLLSALVRGPAGGTATGSGAAPTPPPTGLVGRVAAVLLAFTALSSLSTAAPAFASTPPAVATVATVSVAASAGSAHAGMLTNADGTAKDVATTSDSCDSDSAPTPGWVPDKPSRTDQVARDCAPLVTGKPVADDSGEVVVHRGDTLWSIAARHLGPHADAHAIAAEWPRWYAANRDVIGDNPDQLSIGASLRAPQHTLEGSTR